MLKKCFCSGILVLLPPELLCCSGQCTECVGAAAALLVLSCLHACLDQTRGA